jgi:ferric-dicitrate binding protein FerR (iron transport regulator)
MVQGVAAVGEDDVRCFETEAQLVELLDGKLDQARELAMHAHLETCAECRQRAETWGHLVPVMRRLAPPAPSPLRARRMELEIERLLATKAAARPARPGRRVVLATTVVLAAAAAAVLVISPRRHVGRPSLAVEVVAVDGDARAGGAPLRAGARLEANGDVVVQEGASVSLSLAGARLQLGGPAQLAVGGEVGHVALGLQRGTLTAAVTHRAPGSTFVVSTSEGRVEVRGTRFVVRAQAGRSTVSVDEGRVAIFTRGGAEKSVGAGERLELDQAGFVAAAEAATAAPAIAPAPPCERARPSCEATARQARASMRAGQATRALRLIEGGMAAAGDCAEASGGSCRDELRYLRAEALRQEGRLEAAVQAYKALDHHGAPAAMRQNAFYAAAQLEQRLGQLGAARADFARALTAAPRGALHEEALLGAMDAAAADGDARAAAALAQRYLAESPQGPGAARARALLTKSAR